MARWLNVSWKFVTTEDAYAFKYKTNERQIEIFEW